MVATRILLITPDTGFGELIRQVLVEEGAYDVSLVFDGISALAVAQRYEFALAILDCAADDVPFAELLSALRDWHPGIRLVLIPPDNNPDDQAIDHTDPDALLPKPFYLPDLLDTIASILRGDFSGEAGPPMDLPQPDQEAPRAEVEKAVPEEDADPYPWLADVNHAAQYLARLSLETAARAALITRDEQLWAYAGEMGQPAADQLAETVGRQWGSQSGNDLARFVSLGGEEYMLYATGLEEGFVLALIFDARTPFSKVRSQSSQLAKALVSDPEVGPGARKQDRAEAAGTPESGGESGFPDVATAEGRAGEEDASVKQAGLPLEWLPENLADDRGLLEEVEESLEPFSIPPDWKPRQSGAAGPRAYLEDLLGEPIPSVSFPYERNRSGHSAAHPADNRPYYPPPETMAETRPTRVPPEERPSQMEPESASYFNITYVCVLIPRMPDHHLVRDLARHLEKWMFQICVSFDWRLEQLSIRPDYMQWMVRVHSATAPRFLMQIITRITSQRIFEHFTNLSESSPSGEFWAPGWMVVTSENPPTPQMVQEFISNTRRRQGL